MANFLDLFRSFFQLGRLKLLRQRIDDFFGNEIGVESDTVTPEPTFEQKRNFENYKQTLSILEDFGHNADTKIQTAYLCKVFILNRRRNFLVSVELDLLNPIIKSRLKIEAISMDGSE
jgi:hypothetical protein